MRRVLQPMNDHLHISLYAASAARRSSLTSLIGKNFKRAAIKIIPGLLPLREMARDILIADLGAPTEAADFVHVLNTLPQGFGAVALVDDPEPRWVGAALSAGGNAILSREGTSEKFRLPSAAPAAR